MVSSLRPVCPHCGGSGMKLLPNGHAGKCVCRKAQDIAARLKAADIPAKWAAATLDATPMSTSLDHVLRSWLAQPKKGLLLHGRGEYRSVLGAALLRALIEQGKPGRYLTHARRRQVVTRGGVILIDGWAPKDVSDALVVDLWVRTTTPILIITTHLTPAELEPRIGRLALARLEERVDVVGVG